MSTDDMRFSVPAVWSLFYSELKGTLWDVDDIEYVVYKKNHDAMPAAVALRAVHQMEWKGVEAEDGVLATLKAAQHHYGTIYLTPGQVKEMGRQFTVYYHDFIEPMDDYLKEHCGDVRWLWLNDHGQREIVRAVRSDSEIWIDEDDLPGVWAFTKPGRT